MGEQRAYNTEDNFEKNCMLYDIAFQISRLIIKLY